MLVRCDMQTVLAKGFEMSQRYGKRNGREAFNIVCLTLPCCTLFLGLGNITLLKFKTSYPYTKQFYRNVYFASNIFLDKLKLDWGGGDLECFVFSPYTRPFFFNLCTYNTTGRDGINLWTVENE